MEDFSIRVKEPAQLRPVAERLVDFSKDRRVIAFFGPMGAGKTTFIREVCRVLGIGENVSSPTFSIINEYRTKPGIPVFHFDFYRFEKPEEALSIGVEDYFATGSWCLVEWPEKILNLLPEDRVEVRIIPDADSRLITFTYA
jgi:tRNA threonylcarbamoyladenosine biosynthesis protein TsaE